MTQQTPLHARHVALGARMVDFSGWDMPVHYGSQVAEHHAVRTAAGVFDVSHMTVVDIAGPGSKAFLGQLLANDIDKLTLPGKALYSAMLDEAGGVIDDLIVYWNNPDYLMVVNCGTREKDLAWLQKQSAAFDCTVTERPELAIIALQGPQAMAAFSGVRAAAGEVAGGLKVYQGAYADDMFVARTGYTGEKGLEIILGADLAGSLWDDLLAFGVQAIGLGARDTLRLEAGMNLYGSDMDETVLPHEANMASTVVLEGRDFIGSAALRERLAGGGMREQIALVMKQKGVLRAHYPVFSGDEEVGEITSGAFSPTLEHSIALARIAGGTSGPLTVAIRNRRMPVEQVNAPFVRNGKAVYKPV